MVGKLIGVALRLGNGSGGLLVLTLLFFNHHPPSRLSLFRRFESVLVKRKKPEEVSQCPMVI
jgi:hypothetical protein